MLRDFKFLRRNSTSNEEIENVPINVKDFPAIQTSTDSRDPLNAIQEPKPEQEVGIRSKVDRTPTKVKGKTTDSALPLRTPDKHGVGVSVRQRFGWAQRTEPSSVSTESRDVGRADVSNYPTQVSRGGGVGNGGLANMTPRSTRTMGRAPSSYSECNSTQSTPTKSVSKPPSTSVRSKVEGNGGLRPVNFSALYKGIPISSGPATVVKTVEVPHFDLKEDPSFWMDHNVQVIIRVRPLNGAELSTQGYNRCLKQESSQSITWIGQPETRFTFDHVACETVDQEMLFRMAGLPMVENCLSGYNSCMFAYGQTGSGKTYTMLGDIEDLEVRPSLQRGMTPRIFEFLFARIQAEEETRRDDKLKYSCKCSFLEIYNEQITDLLDPSSFNLLLREDVKKGVYVDNLSEFEVRTVGDILNLLIQGSANRKVAATNMNRESSRSHSVFTCVIESKWEKDSSQNLRFARLNLVDLAGSERQKTSGAEGERLKEAASINKSLSTLGHVIMVLVDVANGRPRHVPYRDSRLTFLLQDSLGGNSKTMIIANVSPSICSAAETLNTLKFAQRAKLIQNNAVVNEDSTGDVIALQHEIQVLKEELAVLKRQNVSRSLSFGSLTTKDTIQVQAKSFMENINEMDPQQVDDLLGDESKGTVRMSTKQFKSLETTLAGALRREQMAETSIQKLEAEIEQLNRLVRQREEDTRSIKMMLRFREDKIQRMESLVHGSIPADTYLMKENRALSEEVQLLQAKVDRNPEVTRFALENIRLLEQIRRFQDFYEEGEREILLDEVSKLREQLLQSLDGNSIQHDNQMLNIQPELKNSLDDLEECRRNLNSCLEENAKLNREIDDLHSVLNNLRSFPQDQDGSVNATEAIQNVKTEETNDALMIKHAEEIMNLQLELDILKIILSEERSSRGEIYERAMNLSRDLNLEKQKAFSLTKKFEAESIDLKEAKSVIDALESQQIQSINEMDDLRDKNSHYAKLLSKYELEIVALKEQLASKEIRDHSFFSHPEGEDSRLQTKLRRMQHSLDKAKRLNISFQTDCALQASNEEEMDEVRRQVEAETAEVIVCMQEELAILQQQVQDSSLKELETDKNVALLEIELQKLQEKLCLVNEDNKRLIENLEEKDGELRMLSEEWELLTCEIEEVLSDGQDALIDASDQLDHISSSFPQRRIWISEQVSKIIRIITEKELLIEELSTCLQDANSKRSDVECMLKSLKGAALAITEAHQQDCCKKEKDILLLTSQLNAKASTTEKLDERLKLAEENMARASTCATVAFVIVNRLSEINANYLDALKLKDFQLKQSAEANLRNDALISDQAAEIKDTEHEILGLREELAELERTCSSLRQKVAEEQKYASTMQQKLEDIEENDILKTREKLGELKDGVSILRSCMSKHAEHDISPERKQVLRSFDCIDEGQTDTKRKNDNIDMHVDEDIKTVISECSFEVGRSVNDNTCNQKNIEAERTCKDVSGRDMTIILLKKEIESALDSLKEVQAEMAILRDEKEEIQISENQSREAMKSLTTQVLNLQAAMGNFEKLCELKMEAMLYKLQALDQPLLEAGTHCSQTKELLEFEVDDAKIVAAQKSAEASYVLAKFEEAQDTMKEADVMINGLIIANEAMKLEVERLKKMEITLTDERDMLVTGIINLQAINDLQCEKLENIEKQFDSNLIETRDLVVELEGVISEVQTTFKENLMSIALDFQSTKSLIIDSTKVVRSWLEDIWSEIIVKDCAVSVLHLCHIGILLETVTGLNVENGLLQHGLCESNSMIAHLREHNFKSQKELEICRILKGKLLADIKSNFDRISRKEEESGELTVKLTNFEKRVEDLQLQEELMLQRSNYMGSQLALLMKELDLSNRTAVASLLDQERLLKDEEALLKSQLESSMLDVCSKDFELLIFRSKIEEMTLQNADTERNHISCCASLEALKKVFILVKVDAEMKEQFLLDKDGEVAALQKEVKQAERERKDLLSKLNQSNLRLTQMEEVNKAHEENIQLLKDVACSHDVLKSELGEVTETNSSLMNQIQVLEAEHKKFLEELEIKETAVQFSSSQISNLDQQNQKLQRDISILETLSEKLQNDLDEKDAELSKMSCLEEEIRSLESEVEKLTAENSLVVNDLQENKSVYKSSLSRIDLYDIENRMLQDKIFSLETRIDSLQNDLEMKTSELGEVQHSQSVIMGDLSSKRQELQIYVNKINTMNEQNIYLRNELWLHKKNFLKCGESVEIAAMTASRLFTVLNEKTLGFVDKMFQETWENVEKTTSNFMEEFECLEGLAKELINENLTLQAELLRKDEVLKGLLFDLSLLQESASNSKDQKDQIEEMETSLETLKDELAVKSCDLDEAVAQRQMLEVQLQEKINIISALELDISKMQELLKLLSCENWELRAQNRDALEAKSSFEEDLTNERKTTESLEMELLEMRNALGQMNDLIESLTRNLNEFNSKRDHLQEEVFNLQEKLGRTQAQADEHKRNVMEAQEVAESRKIYAEEKETEVKLLERSVEELECIINVLENKVDIVKGETERQRLQREELELELDAVKHQMQNVKTADEDTKRYLDEKEKDLQEALKIVQILERNVADKDVQIAKYKEHISELNLHAEAQASEYKQKFKTLEAMAEQVRPDCPSSHVSNSLPNKSEKNAARPRGSGSPFKCIGLGLAQQMKSEKDEDLSAARLRIEELEALALSRQNEIFALNARLASTESMTHDVIRDLVGLKLDMTNYASLLDSEQIQKIKEKAQSHNFESQEKEVVKLKQQLNEFVEERQGWLEEIDRKQAEMVAAQIALEKLRHRDQLLKTENEMLKMENINHKNKVMELEAEAKKLSGQQNLHQRIHHHAKIKEENNMLKLRNEDLSTKLHRAEAILVRVKEELARYRASTGRNPYVNFDEEDRLTCKLKEIEEERVHLAQSLSSLYTSILKAAGVTKPVSDITPSIAEEALKQLTHRIAALERELQDLNFKHRITSERIRLSELIPQSSPAMSRTDETCHSPSRLAFQAPFFSTLDR